MNFLGIDVGTGGSRAVLIDEQGNIVASATVEHSAFTSAYPGWAEHDPDEWWLASSAAIRSVLSMDGVRADEIGAVGLTGQMHGSVFLDDAGRVIRPALLWCDQRTEQQCVEITNTVGSERLIELVSNPAVTGFTLPKILWLRETEPENWQRVRSILLPKDYIRFRLSGDKASDAADSSGTLIFDVANRRWSFEMLEMFALDQSLFPEVYESVEVTGVVSQHGADATGLAGRSFSGSAVTILAMFLIDGRAPLHPGSALLVDGLPGRPRAWSALGQGFQIHGHSPGVLRGKMLKTLPDNLRHGTGGRCLRRNARCKQPHDFAYWPGSGTGFQAGSQRWRIPV